jgi:hypothetical protein
LGEKKVATNDLDAKLREIAGLHVTLLKRAEASTDEDDRDRTTSAGAFDVPGGIARGVYLSRAFATVPDMPFAYDVGALLDELARLRLFVVEVRDFDAMLVRAESRAERAKAKGVTLGAKVTPDLAEQFCAAASRAGTDVSALMRITKTACCTR